LGFILWLVLFILLTQTWFNYMGEGHCGAEQIKIVQEKIWGIKEV
jgi:hypothetical protein